MEIRPISNPRLKVSVTDAYMHAQRLNVLQIQDQESHDSATEKLGEISELQATLDTESSIPDRATEICP